MESNIEDVTIKMGKIIQNPIIRQAKTLSEFSSKILKNTAKTTAQHVNEFTCWEWAYMSGMWFADRFCNYKIKEEL